MERFYYFAEAMAFYEAFYDPVRTRIVSGRHSELHQSLSQPPRTEDRPLTWVPIVWHSTTFEAFKSIVSDGFIKPLVHLTELPLAEIDRIRLRTKEHDQVAIGFTRRFAQEMGITPVLYLKHNPELAKRLQSVPAALEALADFVEKDDDTGSFAELRISKPLPVQTAVWLLTTANRDPQGTERPWVPGLEEFQKKYGRISISHWSRMDYEQVLKGRKYLYLTRDGKGEVNDAVCFSEYYWEKACFRDESHLVKMPAGRDWDLLFRVFDQKRASNFSGPFGFIDLARRFKALVAARAGSDPQALLPYALMPELPPEPPHST
jgi:hypothetical protein